MGTVAGRKRPETDAVELVNLSHIFQVCTYLQGISRKMPEQALGGMPLGLRLVTKINLLKFHVCSRSDLLILAENLHT